MLSADASLATLGEDEGQLLMHARDRELLLVESHLMRRLFGTMLLRIWALQVPTGGRAGWVQNCREKKVLNRIAVSEKCLESGCWSWLCELSCDRPTGRSRDEINLAGRQLAQMSLREADNVLHQVRLSLCVRFCYKCGEALYGNSMFFRVA